jgi:hypothetical protein
MSRGYCVWLLVGRGWSLLAGLVRSVLVVVSLVFGEDGIECCGVLPCTARKVVAPGQASGKIVVAMAW